MTEEEKDLPEEAVTLETADEEKKAVNAQAEQTTQAAEETQETDKLSFRDKKKASGEIRKLQSALEAANQATEELKDRYARMGAEFENYKRRTGKELDARYADAKGDVWKSILPVIDNFERALSQEVDETAKAYREGVEMIYRMMMETMKAAGVEEIDAQGQEFNPELHNAVMHVDDETVGANIVVEVFAKGYKMGDKVLRYSMVKVAN